MRSARVLTAIAVCTAATLHAQTAGPPLMRSGGDPARDALRRAESALELVKAATDDASFVSESMHPWLYQQVTNLTRAAASIEASAKSGREAIRTDVFESALENAANAADSIRSRPRETEASREKLAKLAADLRALRIPATTSSSAPFVAPASGTLYIRCIGGSAGATSALGLGTAASDFRPLLVDLPASCPTREVAATTVTAGEPVPFAIRTDWVGTTYWAFAGGRDRGSVVAFTDVDDQLGRQGATAEETTPNSWVLHLNDAAHYTLSDTGANNLLIEVRIASASDTCSPEFTSIAPNPGLPASYVEQANSSIAEMHPNRVMLLERHSARVNGVLYSLLAYQAEPDAPTITLDGVAVASRRAWTFAATVPTASAMACVATTVERIAALPR